MRPGGPDCMGLGARGRATRWVLAGLGRGPGAPAGGREWRWPQRSIRRAPRGLRATGTAASPPPLGCVSRCQPRPPPLPSLAKPWRLRGKKKKKKKKEEIIGVAGLLGKRPVSQGMSAGKYGVHLVLSYLEVTSWHPCLGPPSFTSSKLGKEAEHWVAPVRADWPCASGSLYLASLGPGRCGDSGRHRHIF